MSALERITEVRARDARNIDVAFIVKDARGAVHFHFRIDETPSGFDERFSCAGVETHYAAPPEYMRDQPPSQEHCQYLDAPCWHDGTSLWARDRWLPGFRIGGTEWVWTALERQHAETFGAESAP